jgi:ketosteroid isomerase-like protein
MVSRRTVCQPWPMSSNLDLVRSIYVAWERGDFSSTHWADPDIQLAFADGPDPAKWTGVAGMAEGWRSFQSTWEDFRAAPTEFIELDDERVLVLLHFSGRAKTSGMELAEMQTKNASLCQVRDGKVVKLVLYWDRDRALSELGLARETDAAGPSN